MRCDRFMDYRDAEEARMIEDGLLLGDVTTVNLTGMTGEADRQGSLSERFTLNFDMRVTPTIDLVEFQNMLNGWAVEAGGGVEVTL